MKNRTQESPAVQQARALITSHFGLTDAERAQVQAEPQREHVFVRRHSIDMGDGKYQIVSVEQRHRLISRTTYDHATKQHSTETFASEEGAS